MRFKIECLGGYLVMYEIKQPESGKNCNLCFLWLVWIRLSVKQRIVIQIHLQMCGNVCRGESVDLVGVRLSVLGVKM
jgi:hypothetical protein